MGYVFVSYASADLAAVSPHVNEIKGKGVAVWIDRDQIRAGDPIVGRIDDGLPGSEAVVIFWSAAYANSGWCRFEYHWCLKSAAERQTYNILVVVLDETPVPALLSVLRHLRTPTPEAVAVAVAQLVPPEAQAAPITAKQWIAGIVVIQGLSEIDLCVLGNAIVTARSELLHGHGETITLVKDLPDLGRIEVAVRRALAVEDMIHTRLRGELSAIQPFTMRRQGLEIGYVKAFSQAEKVAIKHDIDELIERTETRMREIRSIVARLVIGARPAHAKSEIDVHCSGDKIGQCSSPSDKPHDSPGFLKSWRPGWAHFASAGIVTITIMTLLLAQTEGPRQMGRPVLLPPPQPDIEQLLSKYEQDVTAKAIALDLELQECRLKLKKGCPEEAYIHLVQIEGLNIALRYSYSVELARRAVSVYMELESALDGLLTLDTRTAIRRGVLEARPFVNTYP